jgi:hypothetical protein
MFKTALIVVFLIYGLPLWQMRYRWRATVYRRDDWRINVLPWFGHDIAALFTDRYFHTPEERVMARRFRLYLAGYLGLLTWILVLP